MQVHGADDEGSREHKVDVASNESKATEPLAFATALPPGGKEGASSRKRCLLWCCGVSTGVILLVALIFIILIFTKFKPRDPKLVIETIRLRDFDLNVDDVFTALNPSFHITLDTTVAVENPNYAGFKFRNSTAYIYYHDVDVGESDIPAGEVKARSTVRLEMPVEVHVDQRILLQLPLLTRDFASGVLPIVTKLEITGTASFLNIVKLKNARSSSNCQVEIFIGNRTLKGIDCQNQFKL